MCLHKQLNATYKENFLENKLTKIILLIKYTLVHYNLDNQSAVETIIILANSVVSLQHKAMKLPIYITGLLKISSAGNPPFGDSDMEKFYILN